MKKNKQKIIYDVCIVGGAGHIGLPLGVAFALKNMRTVLFDINKKNLLKIQKGTFPFKEDGGDENLALALKKKKLSVSATPHVVSKSRFVVITIGTPIDEYLNPDFHGMFRTIDGLLPYFRDGQILVLRSTIFPGISEKVADYVSKKGKKISVTFCPERIVEGKAFEEFLTTPQIISGFESRAVKQVEELFKKISRKVVGNVSTTEAELAKLFSNAWRYICFATANQFFMIAEEHGHDFSRIHRAMTKNYARNKLFPLAGFAAGPCLLKDTMQLSAFSQNKFFLGHSAMLINEGLPQFVINALKRHYDLKKKTIGILGMAFKGESDDKRDSLAYKLKKIAILEARQVFCHDVHIRDSSFTSVSVLLNNADIIILAAPHSEYRAIHPEHFPKKIFVDVWGHWGVPFITEGGVSKIMN